MRRVESQFKADKDLRRTLITYAAVSDALTSSNDFFLGIAPIFAVVATKRNGSIFEACVFSEDVQNLFGLTIPDDVAHFFAPRLAKEGLLVRRKKDTTDTVYFWHSEVGSASAIDDTISTNIDTIVALFEKFTSDFPSIFAQQYDTAKLEEVLFDFLISRDEGLLAAEAVLSEGENNAGGKFQSEEDYVCARYLQYLEKERQDLFTLLGDISNATILSEVIVELRGGRKSRHNKVDAWVYVDAPLMMDLLGLSGKAAEIYAKSVINGLRSLGAMVAIFDHSVEEIRDNLYGLLKSTGSDRRGLTADAMRRNEVDERFVADVMHNVEDAVSSTSVSILHDPMQSLAVPQRSYFTDADEQRLYQLLHSIYKKEKARDRDILSLRIVISRRAGHSTTNFLRSKHLMITQNTYLRHVSRKFVEEDKGVPLRRVPPAEHISKIAACLWLELGAEQKVEITRSQLVAVCSKVANARPEIIEKLRATLANIVPEKAEQFETLILKPRMLQLAMDVVSGTEGHVTDKTALQAYDELKSQLVDEEKVKAKLEKATLRKSHKRDLKSKDQVIQNLEGELGGAVENRRKAVAQITEPKIRRFEQIATGAVWSFVLLGVAGFATSVVNIYIKSWSTPLTWFGFLLSTSFLIMGYFGHGAHSIRNWLRSRWEAKTKRMLATHGYDYEAQILKIDFIEKKISWPDNLLESDKKWLRPEKTTPQLPLKSGDLSTSIN